MNNYRDINLIKHDNYILTEGLFNSINKELKVPVKQPQKSHYERVLKYLIDYILDNKPIIKSGQAIAYHSWILKFIYESDDYFKIFESSSNGEKYVEGVEYATKVILEQESTCKDFNETPIFPLFNQNIVISKGVYEGLPVDAVRYPSPDHMTGWWLTTELYDDDIKSLMNVHYYHVAFKRPEMLKLLALPYGYRFFLSDKETHVKFDSTALDD